MVMIILMMHVGDDDCTFLVDCGAFLVDGGNDGGDFDDAWW